MLNRSDLSKIDENRLSEITDELLPFFKTINEGLVLILLGGKYADYNNISVHLRDKVDMLKIIKQALIEIDDEGKQLKKQADNNR